MLAMHTPPTQTFAEQHAADRPHRNPANIGQHGSVRVLCSANAYQLFTHAAQDRSSQLTPHDVVYLSTPPGTPFQGNNQSMHDPYNLYRCSDINHERQVLNKGTLRLHSICLFIFRRITNSTISAWYLWRINYSYALGV